MKSPVCNAIRGKGARLHHQIGWITVRPENVGSGLAASRCAAKRACGNREPVMQLVEQLHEREKVQGARLAKILARVRRIA
jgi:hypothetical protein